MNAQDLKNSILSLAIKGKLVEQRAEEGTADNLLDFIKSVKQEKIALGELKQEKPLPEIKEEETPFDIPKNWRWVRLGDYCEKVTDQVASGSFASLRKNVPSLKEPNYAVMVKTADFSNGFSTNLTYTTEHGYNFLSNSNLFGGELILSNIGSIGKCFIVPDLGTKMTLAPNAIMLRLADNNYRDYLYHFILSAQGYSELVEISSGTTMKKFNKTDLKKILIPVPPLAEQQRIVAKLEEILPYIDQYDKAYTKLEAFNKKFPEDMKKSILQMAVQGKLVEQRAEEGTAEALVDACKIDKERAILEGKIKKEKFRGKVIPENEPFEIPNTWVWMYISDMTLFQEGPGILGKDFREQGVPLIRIAGMQTSEVLLEGCNYLDPDMVSEKWEHFKLDYGDIVISASASMDKIAEVKEEAEGSIPYTGLIRFKINGGIDKEYFKWFIRSPFYMSQVNNQKTGGTIKHYGPTHLRQMMIPLPPLAEQHRIVAKIEELLPYCDKLTKQ